nr:hypothetical protein [uncultured Rhodoferax sp.]
MLMEIELIRPAISGLAGGLIAIIFCRALAEWVPEVCNGKSAQTLIRQNRPGIWLANIFFLGGILAGIAIYQLGFLPNSDWRGFALGIGGGSICALLALLLMALATRHSPKEAYVAFAVSQQTPIAILYGGLVLCATAFVSAAVSLFVQ